MSSETNTCTEIEKGAPTSAPDTTTENAEVEKSVEIIAEKANAQENSNEENVSCNENNKNTAIATSSKKPETNSKYIVHKTDFEKDVVYLYQFSRTPLLPSLSPYCLKVETWLRLSGLKYENVDHKMRFRSKKGQLPFVELNGEEIPDSAIIIKELSAKYGKDIDARLTPEQRNISYAMIAMLENHLIWIIFYWRAKYPENVLKGYKVNLQHALGLRVPNSILNFFFKITFGRKGCRKLKAHGIGVHSPAEIEEFGKNDLNVLSEMLDSKQFFFGEEPSTLDVVSFAVLSQLYFLSPDVSYVLRDYMVEKCPNLVEHVLRMKQKCFPDWDDICTKLDLNAHMLKLEGDSKDCKTEKPNNQEKESANNENPHDASEKDIDDGNTVKEGNNH